MGLFTENLPLVLCKASGNEEEVKIQGQFNQIRDADMKVLVPEHIDTFQSGMVIDVTFFVGKFEFAFNAEIVTVSENAVFLEKPAKIFKRKQRDGSRININLPMQFTIWTESGLYDAEIVNMSSFGCKMKVPFSLRINDLISVNFYISKGRHKIRIICQALVRWCETPAEEGDPYLIGIQYTTLSTEKSKKLDSFIREELA